MIKPNKTNRRFSIACLIAGLGLMCGGCDAASQQQNSTPGSDTGHWGHTKTITLNTTPTGANITNDVTGYPLAIVLNAGNFDFREAKSKGEDIRFFDAEGNPLAYAIEDWDASAKHAAIWVRIPVVKANDDKQSIVMKWSNSKAAAASDSKAVFGKEDGYLAVFHLNEDGNTNVAGYKDSSWNEVHGTGQRMQSGTRVDARVGKGTHFINPKGGAGDTTNENKIRWIRAGGEKVTNDFNFVEHPITASGWAWADSFEGYYETIFSKGDRSWTLQRDWDKRIEACMLVTSQPKNYHSCAIANKTNHPPVVKVWNHYMMTARPGRMAVYVNGELADSVGGETIYGFHDFAIANNAQHADKPKEKRGWDGIIDEVRVMSVEKTADWAKLDYETQREGQKAITFGPTKHDH